MKKLINKIEKVLIGKDEIQRIINESKSIFQSNNNLNNSIALDPYYNLPEKSVIIQAVNIQNNFNNNQNNLHNNTEHEDFIEENYSQSFPNNDENDKIE